LLAFELNRNGIEESRNLGLGHTGSSTDIVEGEVGNLGVELQEEGERLANTTGGTEDGNLGELERGKEIG
jgi:hypothetical protein